MIQGIDGMALINALRAGREDRFKDQQRQSAMASQATERGLVGKLFGGQQPQGVTGMASPNPQANVPAQPDMASAFNPAAMTAIGGMDQGGSAPAPMTAQTPPMQPPADHHEMNTQVLQQLVAANPDKWVPVVSALKNMNEMQVKQADAQNMAIAIAAHSLMNIPVDRRQAALEGYIGQSLIASGISPERLRGVPLTDEALTHFQNEGMAMNAILEAEQKRREFDAGKVMATQPGGGLYRVTPNGVDTLVVPNDGSQPMGTPAGRGVASGPVKVTNAQDYANVPPGASYMDPQGHIRQKPGGPTPNASGTFQP